MPRAKKVGSIGPVSMYETTEEGEELREEAKATRAANKKKKRKKKRVAGSYLTRKSYRKSAMDEALDYTLE